METKNTFKLLKTKQVADLLGVKPTKIYQLIANEKLPYIKKGKIYFFIKDSVLLWKQEYDKRQAERRDVGAKQIANMLGVSVASVYSLAKNEGMPCEIEKIKCLSCSKKEFIYSYSFNAEEVLNWFLSGEQNKPAEKENALTAMFETEQAIPAMLDAA